MIALVDLFSVSLCDKGLCPGSLCDPWGAEDHDGDPAGQPHRVAPQGGLLSPWLQAFGTLASVSLLGRCEGPGACGGGAGGTGELGQGVAGAWWPLCVPGPLPLLVTLHWPRGTEIQEGGAGQGCLDPFLSLPAPRWWARAI